MVVATIALIGSCTPKVGQQTSTTPTTSTSGGKDIMTPAGKRKLDIFASRVAQVVSGISLDDLRQLYAIDQRTTLTVDDG